MKNLLNTEPALLFAAVGIIVIGGIAAADGNVTFEDMVELLVLLGVGGSTRRKVTPAE